MHLLAQVLTLVTCHPCTCASLLEFISLFFYFDLSFTVLFLFFPLLHFELHTELDNLIAMQNLRNSANKGSNDAYDVSVSLTGGGVLLSTCPTCRLTRLEPQVFRVFLLRRFLLPLPLTVRDCRCGTSLMSLAITAQVAHRQGC